MSLSIVIHKKKLSLLSRWPLYSKDGCTYKWTSHKPFVLLSILYVVHNCLWPFCLGVHLSCAPFAIDHSAFGPFVLLSILYMVHLPCGTFVMWSFCHVVHFAMWSILTSTDVTISLIAFLFIFRVCGSFWYRVSRIPSLFFW